RPVADPDLHRSLDPRELHSFPTRRSSDLREDGRPTAARSVAPARARARQRGDRARRSPSRAPAPLPRTAAASTTSTARGRPSRRSEEHTSELQSLRHLVCRLLLEKKNYII